MLVGASALSRLAGRLSEAAPLLLFLLLALLRRRGPGRRARGRRRCRTSPHCRAWRGPCLRRRAWRRPCLRRRRRTRSGSCLRRRPRTPSRPCRRRSRTHDRLRLRGSRTRCGLRLSRSGTRRGPRPRRQRTHLCRWTRGRSGRRRSSPCGRSSWRRLAVLWSRRGSPLARASVFLLPRGVRRSGTRWRTRSGGGRRRRTWLLRLLRLWPPRRLRWRGRNGCALRGSRRTTAEPAAFPLAQRLRLSDGRRRGNRCRALDDRSIRPLCTTAIWRGPTAKLLPRHLHGIGNARRLRQHTRPHPVSGNGVPPHRCDNARRDARVDGKSPSTIMIMLHNDSPIDDDGIVQYDHGALRRHDVIVDARCRDVARAHKNPIRRIVVVFVDHVIGRQRRPADVVAAATPIDPGRRPFLASNPDPAEVTVEYPAAVVIGDPAPILFPAVRNPVPAPFVRVDPVAEFVGTPAGRTIIGHPDFAPARVMHPMAVGVEGNTEIGGNLRFGGCQHAKGDRHGDARACKRQTRQQAEYGPPAGEVDCLCHFVPIKGHAQDAGSGKGRTRLRPPRGR